jgi:hypothetical protein
MVEKFIDPWDDGGSAAFKGVKMWLWRGPDSGFQAALKKPQALFSFSRQGACNFAMCVFLFPCLFEILGGGRSNCCCCGHVAWGLSFDPGKKNSS